MPKVRDWHPLDDERDPEPYIPRKWTPEHAGLRLCEAFAVYVVLPKVRGPKMPGNSWPAYVQEEFEDRVAQEQQGETEKQERRRETERRWRQPPTPAEVSAMERVMEWLHPAFGEDDHTRRRVVAWALAKASDQDMHDLCRRRRWSYATFQRQKHHGLKMLAAWLRRTGVKVF